MSDWKAAGLAMIGEVVQTATEELQARVTELEARLVSQTDAAASIIKEAHLNVLVAVERAGTAEARAEALAGALRDIQNVLGPSVPASVPEGPDAEWHEALRIIRVALADKDAP